MSATLPEFAPDPCRVRWPSDQPHEHLHRCVFADSGEHEHVCPCGSTFSGKNVSDSSTLFGKED